MIRACICILFFLGLFLQGRLLAAADRMITLTVPEGILSQALDKSLPISVDTNSGALSGAITLVRISNLQLHDKGLSCRIALKGDNMYLNTEIGEHAIKLKVGSLQLDLRCNAALRFDPGKQLLFVKPVITDLQASSTAAQGDIDAMLMALLNNREFPVMMKQMEPLVAATSGKTINISMNIVNIDTQEGALQFDILPQIQSTSHGAKKK